MSSTAVLRGQLQERAMKAEKLLEQLRPCLEKLRQSAAARLQRNELEQLSKENAVLRGQIDSLVKKLRQTEEINGVVQVSCSRPSPTPTTPSTDVNTESAPHPVQETTEPPKKQEKKVKPKKTPQPSSTESEAPVDVSRLLLKVGKIVDVKKHPDADSLYVETVDLAEERHRTIISGLVKHVPIEQMQDRLAVFACNLKPAKMRGIMSEGMIMCASTPDKVQVVDVPAGAVPGDKVTFAEYPGEADVQLNPKKKIWEALVPDLKTNDQGVATYKGAPFTVQGKGVCQAPGCPNFPIK